MSTYDKKTGVQLQDSPQSQKSSPLKDDIIEIIREYNKSGGFTDRKLTDTPTDALAVVNRNYVTANGTTRPPNPVQGQFFFDTTLGAHGKPIWWISPNWLDAASNIV